MPVIGAVLHLDSDQESRASALDFLGDHPKITLGERRLAQLPIVVESDTRKEDKAVWDEIEASPGITFASVVFADFSDLTDEENS